VAGSASRRRRLVLARPHGALVAPLMSDTPGGARNRPHHSSRRAGP
jgi:hypothetical protein